ncbi:glycosyltransferase [Microbacterium sp. No. 7]|uniref:glycosyltransferase n=1 Tax=Microbacterium sp. No. 7 TaxID=1714373 RepID=UPI0006CFEABE|nr:glycosyltransferase [Microbacterium sp. No. 7]ALJ19081.1 hypothetical protein AOA12_03845 [Microbacterium sp. No. 7]
MPRRTLFVASSGGHVSELLRLLPHIEPTDDSLWVTFDTPQTRSLLSGRRVEFVRYVRPRDPVGVLRAIPQFTRILRRERFDLVVSTGAGIALAALPQARLRGMRALYIESVARVSGPSLTGSILSVLHACELRTQHPAWARGRWQVHPGVLGNYQRVPDPGRATDRPRILVTLGTIEGYRFDSAVDAVLATGLADERTIWQLGATTRHDLPGEAHTTVSPEEMSAFIARSDIVVCHAGVGTLMMLFDAGHHPVVLVRRSSRGEHADDHQAQLGALLAERGLAVVRETTELDAATITDATAFRIDALVEPPAWEPG